MSLVRRALGPSILAAALVCACCVMPAPARADGDPASDLLLAQTSFVPPDAHASPAEQARLDGLLRGAARAGDPIRVAVIPQRYDLGAILVLWRRPERYARFLGAELSQIYSHTLLVVMPSGIGLDWPGHSRSQTAAMLARLRAGPGAGSPVQTAIAAVQRLLALEHVRVGAGAPAVAVGTHRQGARASGAGGAAVRLGALVVAGLAALVALAMLVRRLLALPDRPRGPLLGLAALIVAACAIPILVIVALRGGSASTIAGAATVRSGILPEGQRPAPAFTLTDQRGRRLSLSDFRGRPVLVTFVDPLCRNLCPLEAHVLNAAVDALPAAERPEIIAVSVDPWADARRYLLQDVRRWSLVPQWRWGVGPRRRLAAIWRRYGIYVQFATRRLAGTTVHYIAHSEAAYLVDRSGYERALFQWPFTAADVEVTVGRIAASPGAATLG